MNSVPFGVFCGLAIVAAVLISIGIGFGMHESAIRESCRDYGAFVIDGAKYQCTALGKEVRRA